MQAEIVIQNGIRVAVAHSQDVLISDAQSALDLIMSIHYESECDCVVINKEAIAEDFFVLSTGVAGEILQKFVNYRLRLAIVGDFSHYTSKPLNDFIYECNNGNHIFFLPTKAQAIEAITKA